MYGHKLALPVLGALLLSGVLLFGPGQQAGAIPAAVSATPGLAGTPPSVIHLPFLSSGKPPDRPTATIRPPEATPLPPTATPVPPTDQNTRYVAKNGADTNPGTLALPWRTIAKAASTLSAGQTVYIRAGVYQEVVNFSRSGTASQPINVFAYPGEVPVIDGKNWTLPTGTWGLLLNLSGNYIHVSGIEVRNSLWMGVGLFGQHDTVSNMNVHHNLENGILANGNSSTVEGCNVWENAYSNSPSSPVARSGWSGGLNAARDALDGVTSYATLRDNEVHNNWGEGLSTFGSDHTVMEDNVVYNNMTNIYVSDATNALVQRNLVYVTPNNELGTFGSQVGIMLGDERYTPPSANNAIINNFVYGANRNIYWWQGTEGGGLNNVLIANNTLLNARAGASGNLQISSGTHINTRIYNNVIEQDDEVPVALVGTRTGLSFSNNLWSKSPGPNAAGSNDIVADPQLAKSGTLSPGALEGQYFKLLSTSPGRDHAVSLSQVVNDYFKRSRGTAPDMGGDEYVWP